MAVTLIWNLSQLATPIGASPRRGKAMRELRVMERPVIVIRDGRFAFAGHEGDLSPDLRSLVDQDVDARGATALPGFVDAHTHIVFAGTREEEFNRRLAGETYAQIAATGGGIAVTVKATRAATEDQLAEATLRRARTMASLGTTTAEVKSGYGLSLEHELKQLHAVKTAATHSPVRLIPTCLAAHDFPPESSLSAKARRDYVAVVANEILPAVAREGLAQFCDVFVEQGAFTRQQAATVLAAGRAHGLVPRIHADELSDTDGASLAVEQQCVSADHLMHVSETGIRALAQSDTVANLLPATSFFLMADRYAPARKLIEAGAVVALSTDCNPGSSMTESMPLVIQLACLKMKMTVEQALTAATLHSACSLRLAQEIGSIEEGKRADLVLIDAPNYLHLVYHFAVNLATQVWRDGTLVYKAGSQP